MKKPVKYALFLLAFIMIIGQFIKPKQNIGTIEGPNHISTVYPIPDNIKTILVDACYDCHANKTAYPWYANVFPSSWFLFNHVEGGKKHLNFSEFGSYDAEDQRHVMHEIVEVMEEGEMPLKSYTWLHPAAKITDSQRSDLISWAKDFK